ncbi:G-protein coupled receptor 183-like [Rhinophrynus dorsalis]
MYAEWNNVSDINGSVCLVHTNQYTAKIMFTVYYFIVLFVGSCGNILALHLTYKRAKKISSTDIYLINLAISDALFTLALPGRITYYIMNFHWPFGDCLCRITTFIFYTNTYVGIYFMTCVSVDRYIAVVHALQFSKLRKARSVKYICLVVWCLVLFQTIPLLLRPMTSVSENSVTCMEYFNFESIPQLPVLLLLACVIGYFVPVGISVFCYIKINFKLCKTSKENSLVDKKGHQRRAFTVIMVVLIALVLCFTPYHINIMQFMVRRLLYEPSCAENKAFKMSLQITVALMNINCCIDPIIYFFAFKGYKSRILRIFQYYYPGTSLSTVKAHSESNSNSQNQACTVIAEL